MRQCTKCNRRFEAGETVCPHDGTMLSDTRSFEEQAVGMVLDGKYRVDDFLTRGGMGAVFRGTHVMLSKPVAIKLIKPELVSSDDIVERFLREARSAARLSHPNIVTVHDLGQTEDGTLYIAMELVAGRSLKEVIKEEGALAPDRSIRLLRGVGSALALAHREGVVHRDLKPQNIMVTLDSEGTEIPKLLDFGIAKTFEPDKPGLTSTGMVLGTPHYMSAEQAKGMPADNRSDLYALGVILYEMLVGKVPFDDGSIPQILIKHLNEPPKPPTSLREDIPAALEAVVLRCLEKDPKDRYQSAEELLLALDGSDETGAAAVLAAETVATQPASGATVGETTMAGAAAAALPPLPAMSPPAASTSPAEISAASTSPPTMRVAEAQAASSRGGSRAYLLAIPVAVLAIAAIWLFRGGSDAESQAAALSSAGEPAAEAAPADSAPDAGASADAGTSAGGSGSEPTSGGGSEPPPPPPRDPAPAAAGAASESSASGASAPASTASPVPPTPRPGPAATSASGGSPARAAAGVSAGAGAPVDPPPQPVEVPARPRVGVACDGVPDGCAALRRAVVEECRKRRIQMGRPANADVLLTLGVEEIEARQEQQFGTTFVVRTYSIDGTGVSPHFDDEIFLPPERISFDARLGRDKLMEQSRRIAIAFVNEVETFWREQRGTR